MDTHRLSPGPTRSGEGKSRAYVLSSKKPIYPGDPEWPHDSSQKKTKTEDFDYHGGRNIPYNN